MAKVSEVQYKNPDPFDAPFFPREKNQHNFVLFQNMIKKYNSIKSAKILKFSNFFFNEQRTN